MTHVHEWRRLWRDGYVYRVECRHCHITPIEAYDAMVVKRRPR